MEFLHDAGFAQQVANGIGRLRAVLQPFESLFLVDLNLRWRSDRVIDTDLFDEASVARRAGIGNDNAVKRSFVSTHTFQTNTNCHVNFHLLDEIKVLYRYVRTGI